MRNVAFSARRNRKVYHDSKYSSWSGGDGTKGMVWAVHPKAEIDPSAPGGELLQKTVSIPCEPR
jgi:hypothetical protein